MNYLKLLLRILLVNWWLTPILGFLALLGWMWEIDTTGLSARDLIAAIKEAWTL